MKQYLFLLVLLCALMQVSAQRLYLHDMYNGNYRSYDLGDEVEFMMLDSFGIVKGEIIGFTANGFYLNNSSTLIPLNKITSVVLKKRGGFGRVVGVVVGGSLMLFGTIYVIAGLAFIPEDPFAGGAVAIVGGLMGVGGYAIINKMVRKKNELKIRSVDQINYRLFIE